MAGTTNNNVPFKEILTTRFQYMTDRYWRMIELRKAFRSKFQLDAKRGKSFNPALLRQFTDLEQLKYYPERLPK